jgi:hypothetical protein
LFCLVGTYLSGASFVPPSADVILQQRMKLDHWNIGTDGQPLFSLVMGDVLTGGSGPVRVAFPSKVFEADVDVQAVCYPSSVVIATLTTCADAGRRGTARRLGSGMSRTYLLMPNLTSASSSAETSVAPRKPRPSQADLYDRSTACSTRRARSTPPRARACTLPRRTTSRTPTARTWRSSCPHWSRKWCSSRTRVRSPPRAWR